MLLLDGQPILRNAGQQAASCIVSHLSQNAAIRAQAARFLSKSQPQDVHMKTIHVLQGEYAVANTVQERQATCLSSSDATTCCIVALNCDVTGLCGIAHLDQVQTRQNNCLSPLLEGLIAPELYIVGAFREETSCGFATAHTLLQVLEDSDAHINIQLACIGDINTTHGGAPRCRSLALTRTAESGCVATNITALDKGPSAVQRLARLYAPGASGLESLYDTSNQLLQVSHVKSNLSRRHVNTYTALLQYPDTFLLSQLSTSPQHEEASFVPGEFILLCRLPLQSPVLLTAKVCCDLRNRPRIILSMYPKLSLDTS